MDCHTCSKLFPTAEALHKHIGFFQVPTISVLLTTDADRTQSKAQYHALELIKCLSHAGPDGTDSHDTSEVADGGNEVSDDSDDDQDEEEDEEEENTVDRYCPMTNCKKQLKTFKELQRHFATRM